jgi:hypothetical protein
MLENAGGRVRALAESPGEAQLAGKFGDQALLGAGLDWPDCLAVVALGRVDWAQLARLAREG